MFLHMFVCPWGCCVVPYHKTVPSQGCAPRNIAPPPGPQPNDHTSLQGCTCHDHTPSRATQKRAVCILLECCLVCRDFSVFHYEHTFLVAGILLTSHSYPSLPEHSQHPLFNKRHDSEYRKKTSLENSHQSRTCLRIQERNVNHEITGQFAVSISAV